MKDKLIAELREWREKSPHGVVGGKWWDMFDEILSRHEYVEFKLKQIHEQDKAVEPLAVLADRKGKNIYPRKRIVGMVETLAWAISVFSRSGKQKRVHFYGQHYAAAEAKARQYLESLPDVKGGI